ncbi:MAG: flagellar basal body rod protein FlgC [Planctomycetes bacterium]|nr:flagellar basal body rod protein FlgC [Planctomycetota bacterium]
MFSGMNVSSSGMSAERRRMDVIARNIANANVVATPEGEAYRRKDVIFETVLDQFGDGMPGGVRIKETVADFETPMNEVFDPKHPMADENGIVQYPNVNMAFEMVDMMTSARSYEANMKAMKLYRDMMTQALSLLER